MNYTYISNKGNGYTFLIRKAIENKKLWVLEIYFGDRKYPNVITGRYKTLKQARENMYHYQETNELISFGSY
jgi:hypothetical protein